MQKTFVKSARQNQAKVDTKDSICVHQLHHIEGKIYLSKKQSILDVKLDRYV